MKLKYFGTAAAEGFPGMFCQCDTCMRAKLAGGKNLRTRSQALVNDKLLIDLCPDMLMHIYNYGLNVHEIENILITHCHADHLLESNLQNAYTRYATLNKERTINVYSSGYTIAHIKDINCDRVRCVELFESKSLTADGICITPLAAEHDKGIQPFIYDLCELSSGKRLLYAHDTSIFPAQTWEYMKNKKPYYNFVSLDCTCAISASSPRHLNFNEAVAVKEKMLNMGVTDGKTVFVLNHFSHNGGATYDEMVPIAQKQGFLVSYDTMEIEF